MSDESQRQEMRAKGFVEGTSSPQAATPEVIHVDLVAQPHLPLILADSAFLATLKQVEAQVASFKITDATTAQAAADLQARLTNAGKKLEASRVALVAPFLEQQRKINEVAKGPASRIEVAKVALSKLQTEYALEQRRQAEEAERKRREELAALEKKRQEEAAAEAARVAELQRQAEEAAKQAQAAGVRVVEDDEEYEVATPVPPTETEQKIAAIQAAPAVVAPKPVGVRFKVTLEPVVEDVNKLADIFITKTPKLQAIRAAYCVGWKEGDPVPVCAGVRFEVKRETQSTGRSGW